MGTSERVREIIDGEARLGRPLAELRDDDDLYRHGLTSHASVSVMLALEESFAVEFPDEMLSKQTFQSVAAIRAALAELGVTDDGAPSAGG